MLMEMSMMGSGRMTKLTEWVIISMLMVLLIMENGRMINNMEREQKLGLTGQGMKDVILKEKNMEKEHFVSQMGVSILVIFNIMKYQEKASMCGLMVNRLMDNGRKIKCMVMGFSLGKMAKGTKGTS